MIQITLTFLTFLTFTSFSFSQWVNQNPVPEGNQLRSVFFVNDNFGCIVGADGFILQSTNGGLRWNQQNSGTESDLNAVTFTDTNKGYVAGDNGIILKTSDGGEEWTPVTSGTNLNLTTIKFINSSIGWIAGRDGIILKTTDSGTTWVKENSHTKYPITSLDFISETTGWAACGKDNGTGDSTFILKTKDGGEHWYTQSFSFGSGEGININSVDFIDQKTGWAAGGKGAAAFGPKFCIIKTTDSGNTWILQYEEAFSIFNRIRPNNITGNGFEGLRSVFFKNSNNGYAVGGYSNDYMRIILSTTDGGEHWNQQSFGVEDKFLLSILVTKCGRGWAVGGDGSIFITNDNGQRWVKQLSGSGPVVAENIYSSQMINEYVGYAVGNRNIYQSSTGGVILKTTNSGEIWETQYFSGDGGPAFTSVYFIDELHGWVSGGDYGIYKTIDGGNNWSLVSLNKSKFNPNEESTVATSLFFINNYEGWFTYEDDYNSGIYKTTDGGDSWIKVGSSGGSSIFFDDNKLGWIVGKDGNILKSTDGGESWFSKKSGTVLNLNSVKFFDAAVGMCAGEGGTILVTSDGGENWLARISNSY